MRVVACVPVPTVARMIVWQFRAPMCLWLHCMRMHTYVFEQFDPLALEVPDQFMWGPDYMVAPVLEAGASERQVVFPDRHAPSSSARSSGSCRFTHYFSGQVYQGGTNVSVPVTSLADFPLFTVSCEA